MNKLDVPFRAKETSLIHHKIESKLHLKELELCETFNKLTLEEKEDLFTYYNHRDGNWIGDWDKEQVEEYKKSLDEYYRNKLSKDSTFCFVCSKCKESITDKNDFYFTKKGKILCGKCVSKGRNNK